MVVDASREAMKMIEQNFLRRPEGAEPAQHDDDDRAKKQGGDALCQAPVDALLEFYRVVNPARASLEECAVVARRYEQQALNAALSARYGANLE